jgi:hypothetical protein
MTDPTRYCACGCGTPVRNKWVRGHSARGEAPARPVRGLPGPDDPVWDDPDSTIDLGELAPDDAPDTSGHDAEPAGAEDQPVREAGPAAPDPPPLHGKRNWAKDAGRQQQAPRKPGRITAGIRNDIDAKISFALEIPGRVWQARDPLCGGTFVQQRPEISAALTEIVCQSPDLVQWFAGGGGQFMLWLNLAAAAWPVATVTMAHHVYHSVEIGEPEPEQNYAA